MIRGAVVMRNFFKQSNRGEKGAVTIEAAIALPTFLFVFITLYSLITICRAQAHIQVAINATAKEISQYSYIYGLTGLDESLGKFQSGTSGTKDEINGVISDVAGVFEGIQSIGDVGSSLDIADIGSVLGGWDEISSELDTKFDSISTDYSSAKAKIEAMAENPQKLLLGMAKLIGSETLEIAKSRAIAEPVCRALVQKHLKRGNNDTAEAFCRSVGIMPGTYFGTQSSFNGLDFSNSTLFPYGSDEITIRVTYKVKLIQLLPIDIEFTITQSAVTRGWLHGDKSSAGASASDRISNLTSKGDSLWNTATLDERVTLIRNMGIRQLKDEGYYGVSGQTYIQAYDPATNTFVLISSSNPLYGLDSMSDLSREDIKMNLERLAAQMNSATDNIQKIRIKKQDANGNSITEELECSGAKNKSVIVVIPEDEGLRAIFEEVAASLGSDVAFEFQPSYGSVFTSKKAEGGE